MYVIKSPCQCSLKVCVCVYIFLKTPVPQKKSISGFTVHPEGVNGLILLKEKIGL